MVWGLDIDRLRIGVRGEQAAGTSTPLLDNVGHGLLGPLICYMALGGTGAHNWILPPHGFLDALKRIEPNTT